jgi:nucleotide-binding universal stress UspA family protein
MTHTEAKRIVVGIDGSLPSCDALRWAADEANLRGVTLEVVHAWTVPPLDLYASSTVSPELCEHAAQRVLDAAVVRVGRTPEDPPVEKRLVMGTASDVLVDASRDADLLVVGSHGRGGLAGLLLGSVSQQVLHHARCPVVVVPARAAGN